MTPSIISVVDLEGRCRRSKPLADAVRFYMMMRDHKMARSRGVHLGMQRNVALTGEMGMCSVEHMSLAQQLHIVDLDDQVPPLAPPGQAPRADYMWVVSVPLQVAVFAHGPYYFERPNDVDPRPYEVRPPVRGVPGQSTRIATALVWTRREVEQLVWGPLEHAHRDFPAQPDMYTKDGFPPRHAHHNWYPHPRGEAGYKPAPILVLVVSAAVSRLARQHRSCNKGAITTFASQLTLGKHPRALHVPFVPSMMNVCIWIPCPARPSRAYLIVRNTRYKQFNDVWADLLRHMSVSITERDLTAYFGVNGA